MRTFRLASAAILTLLAAGSATAQSYRSGGQGVPATKQAYSLLGRYPEIDGTMVDVADGQITLRVDYTHKEYTNGQSSINEINRSLAQLQRTRMLAMVGYRGANVAQAQRNLQSVINRNIKTFHDWIDFVLPLGADASIRTLAKTVEFDENGFPKPRNEPNSRGAPGYAATHNDLIAGAKVKVKLQYSYGPVPLTKRQFIGAGTPPPPPPAYAPRIARIVITTDQYGSPLISQNR